MRVILSTALLLGLVGVGAFYFVRYYHSESTANFRTAQVERGDMLPTIEATGTLEPEQVVDIGSQVNGLITEFGADPHDPAKFIDYGAVVEKGTVLAKIDETLYQATVDQNQAALNRAIADLGQMKAMLRKTQADLGRDDELLKRGAIARSDYDAAVAACEVAKANVGVDEAAIKQAEATLKQSKINLGYCSITSPVKGTIVDRRVNVGQTVVSNLSASSLFLLAKDLSRIQVWASVNEADIGRIHEGMKVRFKVDAYANETFIGEVAQTRLNATMSQNVVTYTVVVTTENKDMRLLPYMTASLLFEIDRHENVLKVPNAALRWKPRPKQIAADVRGETLEAMNSHGEKSKQADDNKPEARDAKPKDSAQYSVPGARTAEQPRQDSQAAKQGALTAGSKQQPPGRPVSPQEAKAHKEHHESGRLWIADGNFVRPVPVKIIATDGTMTEVRGEGVSANMAVVIGENIASDADGDATNPFLPRLVRPGLNKPKDSGSGSSAPK